MLSANGLNLDKAKILTPGKLCLPVLFIYIVLTFFMEIIYKRAKMALHRSPELLTGP